MYIIINSSSGPYLCHTFWEPLVILVSSAFPLICTSFMTIVSL